MAEKKTESVQAKPDKVKIKLPRIQGYNKPFLCGINGVNYSIPRGVEVEVPVGIAELISDLERRQEEVYHAEAERQNK